MTLTVSNFEQHSDEWFAARRGIVTASVVGQLITPSTIKVASNETSRSLTLSLIAERITGHTEPTYPSRDMERGAFDEPIAREVYSNQVAPVTECGFMVEDKWGFPIGYSPDGLVGDDGLVEIKSRRQKVQLATILNDRVPLENIAQIQCGLLVSGRDWCDFVSYCGGMPLYVKRVYPDSDWHAAIEDAVRSFEDVAVSIGASYATRTAGLPATQRIVDVFQEMRF